ncbi:type II secretion system F family protein [Paenibacillus ginsengihumi]|uniref:type II secretion system F family protein n=1 Tax=Paenibacillus ginsengihumi TaxID=431596 RepID=UPI00035D3A49|nr:type II secretion system F family protein [Paenibacillus ginsengihumi]
MNMIGMEGGTERRDASKHNICRPKGETAPANRMRKLAAFLKPNHLVRMAKGSRKTKGPGAGGVPGVPDLAATLPRYDRYEMSLAETVLTALAGAVIAGLIGVVFYKHAAAVILLSSAGLALPALRRKSVIRSRKAQLQQQFKQLLASLSSSLAAGKSVESAFREALDDLKLLYPDPRTMIVQELEIINRRIDNGENLEQAVMNLAVRTELEDIRQLAEVLLVCKRSGGNLIQVVRRTAGIIQDKLDIQQEIKVLLAQKRFEANVLAMAPVAMIGVLSITTPDYMEPLYRSGGVLIMTGALGVFIASFLIIRKMMSIQI